MLHKLSFLTVLSLAAFMLSGCGDMKKASAESKAAVTVFHDLYNGQKIQTIYDTADAEFHKAVTKDKLSELLEAVHRKLGNVTSTSGSGWKLNNFNMVTYVDLTQETKFEKGAATESFRFVIRSGKALLINYNINSTDLITK